MLVFLALLPVLIVLDLFGLWVCYLAVMHLKRLRDGAGLSPWGERLGKVAAYLGLLWDVRVNWSTFPLLVLSIPREYTVTSHLRRLKRGDGWRAKVAAFICEQLLDGADPSGCHCK